MNRLVLVVVLLLAPGTAVAQAGPANLSWGPGCWSDPGRTDASPFRCDGNTGEAILTMSFVPEQDVAHLCRVELTLNAFAWGQTDMPDWWKMGAGQCRSTALQGSVDFSAAPHAACTDVWSEHPAYVTKGPYVTTPSPDDPLHYYPPYASVVVEADMIDPGDAPHLVAGTEYYGVQVRIGYTKTIGEGACSGCSFPVNLEIGRVVLGDCDGSTQILTPTGWSGSVTWDPQTAVPARSTSWGAIKSLYR